MVAVTQQTIGCCCTRRATDKSITPRVRRVCRPRSHGGLERLEPDIGKLICPVLRGGGGGNVVSLLDAVRLTVLQHTTKGLPQATHDGAGTVADKILQARAKALASAPDEIFAARSDDRAGPAVVPHATHDGAITGNASNPEILNARPREHPHAIFLCGDGNDLGRLPPHRRLWCSSSALREPATTPSQVGPKRESKSP